MTSTHPDPGLTRVLVLIPTLGFGGAEMDLARNLPRLDRSRYAVAVCAFLALGPLQQGLLDAGIEVIGPIELKRGRLRSLMSAFAGALPEPIRRAGRRLREGCRHLLRKLPPSVRRPWPYLKAVVTLPGTALDYLRVGAAVAAQIRDRRIDVVHAILPNSYLVGAIAALLSRRRPLIMSRVSLNYYQAKYPVLRAVERTLHRVVDVVICNSMAIQHDLAGEGVAVAKIRLIPNGIDLGDFSGGGEERNAIRERLGISPDALAFSIVANLYTYKGHADLFRALHLARDRLPDNWVLLAPGRDIDGHRPKLEALAAELAIADRVRLLGEYRDIAGVLRAADIHVSASLTEGLPNNVLEAMCMGLPVVATAVGGVAEMVVDGHTGLLVPPAQPERLADALQLLVGDPARRAAMGAAGRERAALFSVEKSARAIEQTYAEVAARRRG